jgi:SIR2-like protein
MPEPHSAHVSPPARPFVLFAGAGVSSAPPACLPGWWTLNDAILQALFDRIDGVEALNAEQRAGVLAELKDLRQQNRYPPDYQADFLEEEAGLDYFRALQVLDVREPNPIHRSVARMAARGDIAAIVTTNFDRLFELALEAEGVMPHVAYDTATFDELRSVAPGEVPIIKVHGTVTLPESMIDTRKQRRRGRARALVECLHRLFLSHPLVVAGFSGDDLDSNPD